MKRRGSNQRAGEQWAGWGQRRERRVVKRVRSLRRGSDSETRDQQPTSEAAAVTLSLALICHFNSASTAHNVIQSH